MRLFIALKLQPQVIQSVTDLQTTLKQTGIDAKWVESGNLHVTLKFLGEVKEELLPQAEKILSGLSSLCKPFRIKTSSLGCFPDIKRPRVLWLGITPMDKPIEIITYLDKELAKAGFIPEDRKPHPHITLARIRSSKNVNNLKNAIDSLKIEEKEWLVSEVSLFKSTLSSSGPVYQEIFKTNLIT